jgi:hypothetical protein
MAKPLANEHPAQRDGGRGPGDYRGQQNHADDYRARYLEVQANLSR